MAIKAKVSTRTPCEVIITTEVERPDLEAAYERTYKRYQRWIELPGFRAGKAPRHMIEQKYTDQLKAATVEDLATAILRSVLKQNKLEPITSPRMTEEPEYPESGPLTFGVELEVSPAVELKDYSGMKLTKRKAAISDDDVEKTLKSILEQHATYEELTEERPAAFGDWVVVDYSGTVEEQEVLKRANAWVEISSESRVPVPGFAEELMGVKKGEVREFSMTAPADFFKSEVAGKQIAFSVTVNEVRERVIPELTDELVKTIDPSCTTQEELKEAIRKNQLQYRGAEEQRRLRDLAREQLVQMHPIPLPPSIVHGRVRRLLEEEVRRRMQQGQSEEQVKEQIEEIKKQMTQTAEMQVRAEYILDAIARKESVTVSEQDIMPQLQYYASAFRRDVASVRKMFEREGQLDLLRQTALENKALDIVLEQAEIKEE